MKRLKCFLLSCPSPIFPLVVWKVHALFILVATFKTLLHVFNLKYGVNHHLYLPPEKYKEFRTFCFCTETIVFKHLQLCSSICLFLLLCLSFCFIYFETMLVNAHRVRIVMFCLIDPFHHCAVWPLTLTNISYLTICFI